MTSMSLSKWSNVHRYVSDRVRYILSVADRYGPQYTVTSGFRTPEKQREIWDRRGGWGVAIPGCSLHQYGLAMDVHFADPAWQEWYRASARFLGLHTVSNSPTHVQAIRSTDWFAFRSQKPWCPDPVFGIVPKGTFSRSTREQAIWFQDPSSVPIHLLA